MACEPLLQLREPPVPPGDPLSTVGRAAGVIMLQAREVKRRLALQFIKLVQSGHCSTPSRGCWAKPQLSHSISRWDELRTLSGKHHLRFIYSVSLSGKFTVMPSAPASTTWAINSSESTPQARTKNPSWCSRSTRECRQIKDLLHSD